MTVRCDQCRAVLRKHDPRVTVTVHATVTIARSATHALDQATMTVTPFDVSRVYCTNCYADAPLTFTVQARAPAERPLCDVTMWCARCAKTTYHLALGKQLQCNECRELQTPPRGESMKNPFSCLFLDDDVGLEEPMEEPMEEVELDPFFPSRGAPTPTPTLYMPWTEEK